jgi:AbrB family transcriptional regulator (stage V sporulation protein T)
MSIVVVDDRGRIVIPSKIRRKLNLRKGDAFIILELRNDLIVLKRVDVEKLIRDIAEEVARSGLDFERIERAIEEEANKVAEKKVHDRH